MLLRDMSGAELSHAEVGSTELTIDCSNRSKGSSSGSANGSSANGSSANGSEGRTLVADPGSAGAITLVLQAALPPLALAYPLDTLVLRGGTNVNFSPSIDYACLAQVCELPCTTVPYYYL